MATVSERPKGGPAGRLLGALLAPAVWLERARGRRRWLLLMLYFVVAGAVGFGAWWSTRLVGLPDVGHPFDVAAFEAIDVPDADNAMVGYRRAAAQLEPLKVDNRVTTAWTKAPADWSMAPAEIQAWADSNREALATWRAGTERPDSLAVRPGELRASSTLEPVQDLRTFARLALLEASRLRGDGDVEGAWAWYRAVLRSAGHAGRHGPIVQRMVGTAIEAMAAGEVAAWAADPRVDAAMLRRALADVREAGALVSPTSEMLKCDYLVLDRDLDVHRAGFFAMAAADPSGPWFHHISGVNEARGFLLREPERSRRVIRLAFANWLAYCDLPPADQPARESAGGISVFTPDATVPPSALALAPEELGRWVESAPMARALLPGYADIQGYLIREANTRDAMVVHLAEEAYRREHDGADPPRLTDLVGPYLDRLPPSFEGLDDLVPDSAKGLR